MEIRQQLNALRHWHFIAKPYQRVFLLSHMRAHTSLMGHILGSHPQVEGYYEMHIGYFSWKSRYRQKLLHFSEHQPKSTATMMFDKILHNEHKLKTRALKQDDKLLVMIRRPDASVFSIRKLFADDSKGRYQSEQAIFDYYSERLTYLAKFAKRHARQYYFLPSEHLLSQPNIALGQLSDFLELSTPLKPQYQTFRKTGADGAGDNSAAMMTGQILPATESSSRQYPPCPEHIWMLYGSVYETLAENAVNWQDFLPTSQAMDY